MTILFLLYLLLFVGACVCFGAAAFSARQPRVNLVALGLLLFAAVFTIQALVQLTHVT